MASLNKSTFFKVFFSYLPLIILFISVFNEFDFNYLKIENFCLSFFFKKADLKAITKSSLPTAIFFNIQIT